jgi:1-phosphofructokinase
VITTVTPNPSVDWTLEIPALTRGMVHRIVAQHQEPSGKGVNVTRALTGNRVPSVAVLPVGGNEGAELEALLAAEQVSYRAVPVAGPTRVNISLTEPDGTATKINAPGPTLSAEETEWLLAAAAEASGGVAWVVGSGSLPGGVGETFYAQLGVVARRCGARFALDGSGAPLLAGLRARPDVIKPNTEELAQAVGRPLATFGDVVVAARELGQLGAPTVVVSMGRDGALLVDQEGALYAEAVVAAPKSTVGAGDALLAGYLAGTLMGDGMRAAALREAVAWASGALRLDGSRVPMITESDRAAVVLDDTPNLARRLRQPARPGLGRSIQE